VSSKASHLHKRLSDARAAPSGVMVTDVTVIGWAHHPDETSHKSEPQRLARGWHQTSKERF
jgi:hypothetical protein